MNNFVWYNPTKIVFGKNTIASLADLLPKTGVVLMVYGGGSIKANGVYKQVKKALGKRKVVEFSGIEPNPHYETCMKAIELGRKSKATFVLAVGGGSVGDACKFIAAGILWKGRDPWEILSKGKEIKEALPLGCVITLPATGTEANPNAVISRVSTNEKLSFASDKVRPVFSILDPETTYSLDKRQTANGIVDTFVHVCEQYLTYPVDTPLQDRQAEAILTTLIEIAPALMKKPKDYNLRATMMFAAYQGLDQHLTRGVVQDWATHMIGHELTAEYGIDHARSLAIVQPGVWEFDKKRKAAKLVQYAERVWGVTKGSKADKIKAAIEKTEKFYRSLGVMTRLPEYKVKADTPAIIRKRLEARGNIGFGEYGDITTGKIEKILKLRMK